MMGKIRILNPGVFTTVQDLGRCGYQQYGMPVSGAMDIYSLQLANLLVGNNRNEACLEVTYMAPEIEFLSDTIIGIAGANIDVTINDIAVNSLANHWMKVGDILKLGSISGGARIYIAFAGGIKVPEVMGSKSTYFRGQIGGFKGRALKSNDEIEIGKSGNYIPRRLKESSLLAKQGINKIRVVADREARMFSFKGIHTFLSSEYTISNQSDRMGYRLDGPNIEHKSGADILSSGIVNGTIQVAGHGTPIIMLADRQTVGGYTKIANVISVDLPVLGQLMPGNKIKFVEVELDVAHRLLEEQEKRIVNCLV